MNAFTVAAALTALTATTIAFAAQTQGQPSSQSGTVSNAATNPYRDSAVSPDGDVGADSGPASCQLDDGAMKDAAGSTAFAATAAQDGMVEVALAGLALRKSGDDQLRQLAQKMVLDYARSNGGLDSIVKCKGLILPTELDSEHNLLINRFRAKSGRVFEKAYLRHVAEKHSRAVTLFESAATSGDPDLAAFARKGLSMLQEHQLLADSLRGAVGTELVDTH